ncbi:MAG TPA: diguanylate cyclase [Bacteroidales bacterium]|nr:diguanylate cyclase [Bacteroidales bacterium]
MANLETTYLGLELKNPIIVGSSGLTNSVSEIIELEQAGAGAIVLKSIFEEEILMEYQHIVEKSNDKYDSMAEYFDYLDYRIKQDKITAYIDLIKEVKAQVSIPVIASINCSTNAEWAFFAKKIEEAGADALEINVYFLPTDMSKRAEDFEKMYFDIVTKVRAETTLPIALKLGSYFTNMASFVRKISETGIYGVVLFNRFYSPDFDLKNQSVITGHVFSSPDEYFLPLRWVSVLSNRVSCDIAASGGIHDGNSMIKMLLAGADAVQVVSAIYKNGREKIGQMLIQLDAWMDENEYQYISEFKGKLSQSASTNPAIYERVQFMKYYSDRV